MRKIYRKAGEINLIRLSYETFKKEALDLPLSLQPNYNPTARELFPYSAGYGSQGYGIKGEGFCFMPQLFRELDSLPPANKSEALSRLRAFALRLQSEAFIPSTIEDRFMNWKHAIETCNS